MADVNDIFRRFEQRRIDLDMPVSILSQRSGVPRSTVVRILAGKSPNAGIAHCQRIAKALDMELCLTAGPAAAAPQPHRYFARQLRHGRFRLYRKIPRRFLPDDMKVVMDASGKIMSFATFEEAAAHCKAVLGSEDVTCSHRTT